MRKLLIILRSSRSNYITDPVHSIQGMRMVEMPDLIIGSPIFKIHNISGDGSVLFPDYLSLYRQTEP
jgi:hypothetical protein